MTALTYSHHIKDLLEKTYIIFLTYMIVIPASFIINRVFIDYDSNCYCIVRVINLEWIIFRVIFLKDFTTVN